MSAPKKKRASRAKAQPVLLPVIRVVNPFDPREFVRETLPWKPKQTLDAYFPLGTASSSIVSINGKIVPQDQFSLTYLDKTDNLVICPVPTGGGGEGGGGKNILAMVAMIAVAVFAPYLAGTVMGLTAGTVGYAVAVAGITMAGSMLVHSIFAPSTATDTNKATNGKTSSYGIDGAKNTSIEGIPVPVCYGEFRMGGNVLGLHIENEADDDQTLYMLISAGEGPIASITDIEINDNPIADYKEVEVQTRLGLPNQLPIPWFSDTVVAHNKGLKLTTDWIYHTTTTIVDKLRLDFVAAQGLYTVDAKTGALGTATVALEIEYRPVGAGAWSSMPTTASVASYTDVKAQYNGPPNTTYDAQTGRAYMIEDGVVEYIENPELSWVDVNGNAITDPTQVAYLRDNPPAPVTGDAGVELTNRVPVYSNDLSLSAAKRSAVRKSFPTPTLGAQKYEIRVRRATPKSTDDHTSDDVYLSDVNEITLDTLSYANTALVALKIKLTDQLNGLPKVTYINGGRMIQVHDRPGSYAAADQWYDAPSKNPAWVVWDILTNRRYGGGMPTSRLDFYAFKRLADYCDAQDLTWNGVLESEMNVWDATQLVLRCGHAQIVNVGTRYTVVVEKADTPVMMFSVANMVENSYKETWLSTTDRANEIDVTFFDRTDAYKQRTVKVYDPAALAAGAKQRTSAITLYGVVDYEKAYKEAQFQLNLNRYILKTISFAAPMEAVACTVGSLIYVQHDMTEWAVAGRFDAGSTTSTIKLDRPITMEAGKQYKLLALQNAVWRAGGTITNVVGDSLFLTGYGGNTVRRIKIGTRDLPVAGVFNAGSGHGVIVEGLSGVSVGESYTLWDTDVIEEHNVVNVPGETSTITLQAPMSFAPEQFVNWMFGESDKVKQTFRVKSISGSHDYTREITAIEYKPEVYDHARFGSNVPVVPFSQGVIGPVQSLTVYEETYVAGSSIVSRVVANWRPPSTGMYAGADVYVKINDGELTLVGQAAHRLSYNIEAARGDTVVVKVVSYDMFDKRSAWDLGPAVQYKVVGELSDINVGDVTGADFYWSGRDCKLSWRYNATTHSYEFGSEPNGADAGALDPQFKDYEIRVYDKTHTKLRRTEHTTDNTYTYTFDKNFADGITRFLVFEVRMRDVFNNLGEPATLEAYNPPPTIAAVNTVTSFESATLAYTHSNDPDFAGVRVWLTEDPDAMATLPASDSLIVYEGPDTAVLLPGLMFARDYYFRLAAFDAFGTTELMPTALLHFKTSTLDVDAIADGVIGDSKLVKTLTDRIDLIDADASVPGSVDARLVLEREARDIAIENEATARANALIAEAAARGAAITAETTTRQTQFESFATEVNTVTAALSSNVAAQQTQVTAVVNQTESLATTVDTLVSTFNDNTALVTQEASVRSTADSVLAEDLRLMKIDIDEVDGKILQEAIVRGNNDNAEALQRNNQVLEYHGKALAAIEQWSYSKVTSDFAFNQVYQSLRSELKAGDDVTLTKAEAFITENTLTLADIDSAVASRTSQFTARLDNLGGSGVTLEQYSSVTADKVEGLRGQFTVKIDNNGFISGFGLASTLVNGEPLSEFAINADRFMVVTGQGGAERPFTIGPVNGVTRTIIKSALIGDASINAAKIGELEVNEAHITNLTIGTNKVKPFAITQAWAITGTDTARLIMDCQGDSPVLIFARVDYFNPGGGTSAEFAGIIIYKNGIEIDRVEVAAVPSYANNEEASNSESGLGSIILFTIDPNPKVGTNPNVDPNNIYDMVLMNGMNGSSGSVAQGCKIACLELKK